MYDQKKKNAATAALEYVKDEVFIGVGTGSTINYFIEQLATLKHSIEGCVSSSEKTTERLRQFGLPIIDLNAVPYLNVYVDGADEVTAAHAMIKGGGGALTREKIIATVAKQFICLVDDSKIVTQLGAFPIAVEVLPLARSYVARELVKLGGDPEYRAGEVTDNGNILLDVYGLDLTNLKQTEQQIKCIVGVVEHGLFAERLADIVIVGSNEGCTTI